MGAEDRVEIAEASYQAFALADRAFFEQRLSDSLVFSAPPDPHLDRAGWFERCWPGAGGGQSFEIIRSVETGDEVIVTYRLQRPDGSGGFNTEVLTFDAENKIVRIEVYFGWNA